MAYPQLLIAQEMAASETSDWTIVQGVGFAMQASWDGLDTANGNIYVEVSQDGKVPTRIGSIALNTATNNTDAAIFATSLPYNFVRAVVDNTATTGTLRIMV